MRTIRVGDAELYYEIYGSGEPLLLVPGLGGVGSYWQSQLPEFSRHYRVILHDHRGTGKSERSRIRYSVEQMTADLLGLMDALRIESAHLVGQSTGGAMGQIVAIEHPQRLRKLVLSSTWTTADPFFRRCFAACKELLLKRPGRLPERVRTVHLPELVDQRQRCAARA